MAAEAAAAEQNGLEQHNGGEPEFNPDAIIDEDDPRRLRPADIDADVRDMERRRRVEVMMNSRTFRDDLERIVDQQLREGGAAGLFALQQHISDLTGMGTHRGFGSGASRCVIPINDIKGVDFPTYVKGEKIMRCKLAALYRLVDLFGWSQSIYNHITIRVSQEQEHFLLNPFGLLYSEVTASSLIKVDMQGNLVDPGTTNFGVNVAGFVLHSAIHAARPDAKCVMHIHHPACVAVSALKCGFLPVSQESVVIGEVSYHDYYGILVDPEERDLIQRNLGPVNKVMFLRNHGLVILGDTLEEAFARACSAVLACESQVRMMPVGIENLVIISDEAKKRSADVAKRMNEFTAAGRGTVRLGGEGADQTATEGEEAKEKPRTRDAKWRQGDMEFEAYMRMLDNSGYRTGYPYRVHSVRNELPRMKHDVEVPPAVSSFGYLIEEDELYKNSPLRKLLEGRRTLDKNRWINSPNVYQKIEISEQGSQDPKKITKWVPDGSPTHSSTPVKLEIAHQFVPMGTSSKEFKQKQKQIKENRRQGGISAGPQSHVLEGVSWDEAQKLQDANMSGTGDHVVVVGAASKGIIQRDFQHHAMVYRTPYAKNPFDSVTDQEIEEYKQAVTTKKGPSGDDQEHDVSYSTSEAPALEPLVAESVVLSASGEPVRPERKGNNSSQSPTSPRSPRSDEDASHPRVVQVAVKQVPQEDRAQRQLLPPDADELHAQSQHERSKSARFPRDGSGDAWDMFKRRSWSLGRDKRKHHNKGAEVNGDELDNPASQISQSSRDESSARDMSTEDPSSKAGTKDKKKKKGLRTPSFLKKKSKEKKQQPTPEA